MKKILIFAALLAGLIYANAQTSDTIRHRVKNYYYDEWYDTLPTYLHNSGLYMPIGRCSHYGGKFCVERYTDRPLKIIGIAVMVNVDSSTLHLPSVPDFVGIGVMNFRDTIMTTWEMARWDTLTPKVMEFRLAADVNLHHGADRAIEYRPVYEAYFGKEILVDSTYCMYGTCNSQEYVEGTTNLQQRKRFRYQMVICNPYDKMPPHHQHIFEYLGRVSDPQGHHWRLNTWSDSVTYQVGAFLPIIIPQYYLRTSVDDSVSGSVYGAGYYEDSTRVTLRAVPNFGYRFLEWGDHDTNSTRQILVTQDTMLRAYFEPTEEYRLEVYTENSLKGTVNGGGIYAPSEVATISATANSHYVFDRWNDGDTANPRNIVVVSDTAFTAYFVGESQESIAEAESARITLSPNPTSGKVRVSASEPMRQAAVYDMAGKEVFSAKAVVPKTEWDLDLSSLPSGSYIVKITTKSRTATRKLIVE
ncbi:MAG: T9SS type A sorting domain-containing protein [Bacteroidales bacterium]|nr:T9SS type A sorting domain-containing protein [Bacteroidales bacterium]